MTHYNTDYSKITDRKKKDEKAIQDIFDWFAKKPVLVADLAQLATCIEHGIPTRSNDGKERIPTIEGLNMTFGFGGVSGYPFHAFCRRYCPNKYREWMTSGPDAVELDDENFTVEKRKG